MTQIKSEWKLPLLLSVVVVVTISSVYAAIIVTYDEFISYGHKHWGEKDYNNSYTGTLGKYYFCRNNDGTVKTNPACPVLIDSLHNNYVRHADKLASGGKDSSQTILQGKDPWNFQDNVTGGAVVHNDRFPRIPYDDYKLTTQYSWFKANVFADSIPNSGAPNGNVKGALLTNLWFVDKTTTKTPANNYKNVMVIDFYFANVKNSNGAWIRDTNIFQIGGQYVSPFVDINPNDLNQCVYHYNVIVDSQDDNGWHEVSRNIKNDIWNAFQRTYTDLSSGQCSTTMPYRTSSATINTNYDMVDQETGVEVWADTPGSTSYGTLVGAFTESKLEDTT